MDRRSGMWRRDSSEKCSAESESSGSVSSYSERFSDEQGVFRSSPNESSPNHTHSPEVSSINEGNEGHETVKSLSEKLSAALLDAAAKEHLVKQHAKVTEEAISGWESAEAEVAALKQQLDVSSMKNSVLEDRISHLDEALKECVRQHRQSREEQEKKFQDALTKVHESESNKSKLETKIKELYEQLETAKLETFITTDKSYSRLESLEKENNSLKTELLSLSEQLRICTLERDLSTQTAESASKQHLESIKKVAKLESECRRLRFVESRTSSTNFQRPISSTVSGMHNEQESLDSWASALIAELDQFKQEKACSNDVTVFTEIDLMDDFLEMEKLVATPDTDHGLSTNNLKSESDRDFAREDSLRIELETLQLQVAELDKKVESMANEKAQLKMALAETQNQLETSCDRLTLAGDELVYLQRHLDMANELKQVAMAEAFGLEERRKETESQLEQAHLEVMKLGEKVDLLQGKLDEQTLLTELEAKFETLEATRKELQSQLNSACMQAEKLREQVSLSEEMVEEERALCAAYSIKAKANEDKRKELEIQLTSAKSDLEKSKNTIAALEIEVERQILISSKLSDRAEKAEAATISLESQLELAHSEAERLHSEVTHLQEKVEKETTLGDEYSAKCKVLEEELSRRKKGAELWRITNSNGDWKLNKEKELAEAAGRFVECQKTIASLGQQIKSLTKIDEFIFEAENPESDGRLPCFNLSEIKTLNPNGSSKDSDWYPSPLSSSAPALPGLARLLHRSRSSNHIENP